MKNLKLQGFTALWTASLTRLARLFHRRLPKGAQFVLQHLSRQAQDDGATGHATRTSASRQSFLRDLLEAEEHRGRQPGE